MTNDTIDPYDDDLDWIGEFDGNDPIVPPDGGDAANNMLRWLARTQTEIAEIDDVFDREIIKLQNRREDLTAGLHDRAAKLRAALTDFGLAMRDLGSTKTDLPHGTVSSKAGSLSITVDDEAQLQAFDERRCRTLTIGVWSDPQPSWRPAKKEITAAIKAGSIAVTDDGTLVLAESGEIIPGVRRVRGDTTVTVTPT